jgi:putative endonuclease
VTTAQRLSALRRGRWAERWAALWLVAKGYRVLARNLRTPFGEIDLVARRGRVVALVEVKTRTTPTAARDSLKPIQQQRIARAGAWYVDRTPRLQGFDVRCDLIVVAGWRRPVHLPDAWQRQDAPGLR